MKWRLAVGGVLALACLVAVVWDLDLASSVTALATYEAAWLIPVVVTMFASFIARVWRFQALLDAPLGARQHASVMAVGMLAIVVAPLRLGEAVRPWLLVDRYQIPLGSALAAVLVERVLDVLGLAGLLLVTAIVVDPSHTLELNGVDLVTAGRRALGGAAVLGVCGVLTSALLGERMVDWIAASVGRVSPTVAARVRTQGDQFVRGTALLISNPRRGAQALLGTVLVWTTAATYCAFAMRGMAGLEPTVELVLANWSATVLAIVLIPTPAYVGAFEVASVGSLTLLGITKPVATAFALGLHAVVLLFTTALGLVAFAWEGWSLRELVGSHREDPPL